jgi:hypothetical protein
MSMTWSVRRLLRSGSRVKLEKLPGPDIEMWTFPMETERGGFSRIVGAHGRFSAGGNSVLIYFSCEDCANEESRVVPAGGSHPEGKVFDRRLRIHLARLRYRRQHVWTAFAQIEK